MKDKTWSISIERKKTGAIIEQIRTNNVNRAIDYFDMRSNEFSPEKYDVYILNHYKNGEIHVVEENNTIKKLNATVEVETFTYKYDIRRGTLYTNKKGDSIVLHEDYRPEPEAEDGYILKNVVNLIFKKT